MSTMSEFFFYWKKAEQPEETDGFSKFSIMQLELPWSSTKFQDIISGMSTQTKDTVRMQLHADNYFMPFMYLFLFFCGCYMILCYNTNDMAGGPSGYILWVPFIAWLLDIVENRLIDAAITSGNRLSVQILITALLKFTVAIIFFLYALIKYLLCVF